jgi:hypothetical protein
MLRRRPGSTDHARPSFSEVLDTGIESEDSFRRCVEQWDYRLVCFIQLTARVGRELRAFTCSNPFQGRYLSRFGTLPTVQRASCLGLFVWVKLWTGERPTMAPTDA